jgi:RNA polymerase sigma-70 factor, ECF subfamily
MLNSRLRLNNFKAHEDAMDHKQRSETSEDTESPVREALEGGRTPLNELLAGHRFRLYRTALRILRNPEDAEDAVQNALLNAIRHIDQFEGRSKFSTWLTRVVINQALMARRSKHAHRLIPLEDCISIDKGQEAPLIRDLQPDPERVCSSSEIRALLNEEFSRLPACQRSAFRLRYIDGLSCAEAGQSLGISVAALKSRVVRAKRQIVQSLNHAYGRRGPQTRSQTIATRKEVVALNAPQSFQLQTELD